MAISLYRRTLAKVLTALSILCAVVHCSAGESGGANLALALAIQAQRTEHMGAAIDGVYASCPFISGLWGGHQSVDMTETLRSLHENDGMFINSKIWGIMVDLYIHSDNAKHFEQNKRNPLAFPYWAAQEDLRGLPPHVISVTELDGLRDEGLEFYRKLLKAGVQARCFTINGTCHAADLIFRKAMPDVYAATLHNVKQFVDSVGDQHE